MKLHFQRKNCVIHGRRSSALFPNVSSAKHFNIDQQRIVLIESSPEVVMKKGKEANLGSRSKDGKASFVQSCC